MNLEEMGQRAQAAARVLGAASAEKRTAALERLAILLCERSDDLLAANARDVQVARDAGRSSAFIDRLTLTPARIEGMAKVTNDVAALPSRTGRIIEERTLPDGVNLRRVSVPLGVIGFIYESRPNVTVDVAALCIKSGNVAILKGGSESLNSNRAITAIIHTALRDAGLPEDVVQLIDSTDRAVTMQMLRLDRYIDVLIPRGGYDLVRTVVNNSTIPALYHAEGGARIYVDKSADLDMAAEVSVNAKAQRPGVCNAADTLVVHSAIAGDFLQRVVPQLQAANVQVRGDTHARELMPQIVAASDEDWNTEYLDYIIGIRVVEDLAEALDFIARYSKRHSEGIIAGDPAVIETFLNSVDAAALFVNCSTRLHDGNVFGLGAEMGIATGKLHARGPVALDELTTYKWIATGTGQIRE